MLPESLCDVICKWWLSIIAKIICSFWSWSLTFFFFLFFFEIYVMCPYNRRCVLACKDLWRTEVLNILELRLQGVDLEAENGIMALYMGKENHSVAPKDTWTKQTVIWQGIFFSKKSVTKTKPGGWAPLAEMASVLSLMELLTISYPIDVSGTL